MKKLKLNKRTTVKGLAAAWIFTVALFLPVFLCGCGDNAESDELLLSLCEETDTVSFAEEEIDAVLETESEEAAFIYVYVCGAVNNPDVYEAKTGSRLFEVIEMAGGFTPGADRASLNLARTVADGEQIVVYTTEETANNMTLVSEMKTVQSDNGLVNINRASLSELTAISGIGESRAKAIIDYREKNGGFASVEDIKKVDGIKDGLFSKIKDYITV